MPDPGGDTKICALARGAKALANAFGDFVKAGLAACLWALVAGAGAAVVYLGFRAIWWGVHLVLRAVGA